MIHIHIDEELKRICKDLVVGCIEAKVEVEESNDELWNEINTVCDEIINNITLEQVTKLPKIKESREAYKKIGKDPSRYRLSSESLVRRIVKEKGLYKVNNIVDINNLVSIRSHFSSGCFDISKLNLPVTFTIGKNDEIYNGIGRGVINIENLPIFRDALGSFGSTTSDSERTRVTMETKEILMVIISFSGEDGISQAIEHSKSLLKKYANARDINTKIIK